MRVIRFYEQKEDGIVALQLEYDDNALDADINQDFYDWSNSKSRGEAWLVEMIVLVGDDNCSI